MTKVLFVLTSHTQLGDTGEATGFYYEELAAPFWTLKDAGFDITLASIAGGPVAHDPKSLSASAEDRDPAVQRFLADESAMMQLQTTQAIDEITPEAYDAIFLPGGHGTVWDFPTSEALSTAVSTIYNSNGIVGAVCHGPAGLVNAKKADGTPLVQGMRVNGFTDAEEAAVGLTDVVPFLLESKFRELGAHFVAGGNFTPYAVRDDRLITGQNPMSSQNVADMVVEALSEHSAAA